jgi:hypothetical protein
MQTILYLGGRIMAINISEIFDKVMRGDFPTESRLGLVVNEELQQKSYVTKIPFYKMESGKRSKMFLEMYLSVPFNPFTGVEDEKHNPQAHFRLPISATSTSLILKKLANDNPESKKMFCLRAGVDDWDTSDWEHLNDTDKRVLRRYRLPRVYTLNTISVNDSVITGWQFSKPYTISVSRNEDGEIVGTKPTVLRIGEFCESVTRAKINELTNAINCAKSGEPVVYHGNNPFISRDSFASADDKVRKEWISKLYAEGFMSSDVPINHYICFEYPMSEYDTIGEKELLEYRKFNPDDVQKHRVLYKMTQNTSAYLADRTKPGTPHDVFWDFVEFELLEKSGRNFSVSTEKADAGKMLKPSSPAYPIKDKLSGCDDFVSALRNAVDAGGDIEKNVASSLRLRIPAADEALEAKIVERVVTKISLENNPYITPYTLREYSDILPSLYKEDYDVLMLETDEKAIVEAKAPEIPTNLDEILSVKEDSVDSSLNVAELDLSLV